MGCNHMIVQACLNGARASGFHSRFPLAAEAMAHDGASCVAAGAGELHFHPRRPNGQESLAAVDVTIIAIRRVCPGTLVGVSTGAWIENDEEQTRNSVSEWNELPDYASVNLSEPDAPAVMKLLRRRGIGIEAGLASVVDAERFVNLDDHDRVFRILIEIEEQDLGVGARGRRRNHCRARPSGRTTPYAFARLRRDSLAICRACASATMVDAGWTGRWQASRGWDNGT